MKKLLLFLSLFIYGCATPLAEQNNELDSKTICCTSYRGMRVEGTISSDVSKIRIDENSQVFNFNGKKRYFKLLDIKVAPHRTLNIKSYFNGTFIGQYLRPVIVELDADDNVISTSLLQMTFYGGDLFGDQDAHMYGFINLNDKTEKIIVYGTFLKSSETQTIISDGGSYGAGSSLVVVPAVSSDTKLEYSPTGLLKLWLGSPDNVN